MVLKLQQYLSIYCRLNTLKKEEKTTEGSGVIVSIDANADNVSLMFYPFGPPAVDHLSKANEN